MKILQYMSDLHLEFASMPVPSPQADVLVLAGDIHTGVNAIAWIEQCSHVFKHVIYVLGNHEYYGQKTWKLPTLIQNSLSGYAMDDMYKLQKLFDPIINVYLLDNSSVILDGVHFHGSTLWSMAQPELMYKMNDFSKITHKYAGNRYGRFSPEAAQVLHMKAKNWLHKAIVPGEKNVVITHFAPTYEMISSRYKNESDSDVVNTGYATEIIHEFNPTDIPVWISGHTHGVVDKVVAGIHTVSNCRGYVPYEANPYFNPNAMVEI